MEKKAENFYEDAAEEDEENQDLQSFLQANDKLENEDEDVGAEEPDEVEEPDEKVKPEQHSTKEAEEPE